VFLKLKAKVFSNITLSFLDRLIHKLLYMPAIKANQVVVVLALIKLINRSAITLAGLKMAAEKKPRLLKLGKDAVDRGKTNFLVLFGQGHKDILSTKVGAAILMKKIQNFHAWTSGL